MIFEIINEMILIIIIKLKSGWRKGISSIGINKSNFHENWLLLICILKYTNNIRGNIIIEIPYGVKARL